MTSIDTERILQSISPFLGLMVDDVVEKTQFFVPEEIALAEAMIESWKPVYRHLRKQLKDVVDFETGRVTRTFMSAELHSTDLDELLVKALTKISKVGKKYIAAAFDAAWAYEKSKVTKADVDLREWMIEAVKTRLDGYAQMYMWQHVGPEVESLINWMFVNQDRIRAADLATITKRLDNMLSGRDYWAAESNVHTARAYQFGAITYFEQEQITKYMINSIMDTRICMTCMHMHGKVFETRKAVTKMMDYREGIESGEAEPGNADFEKSMFPYAKRSDVDNVDEEYLQIHNKFTLPPFHPHCRCVVTGLGRFVEGGVDAASGGKKPKRKDKDKDAFTFKEVGPLSKALGRFDYSKIKTYGDYNEMAHEFRLAYAEKYKNTLIGADIKTIIGDKISSEGSPADLAPKLYQRAARRLQTLAMALDRLSPLSEKVLQKPNLVRRFSVGTEYTRGKFQLNKDIVGLFVPNEKSVVIFCEALDKAGKKLRFGDFVSEVLEHELGHAANYGMFEVRGLKDAKVTWYASSWKPPSGSATVFENWGLKKIRSNYVSDYAMTNQREDFAENFAWYGLDKTKYKKWFGMQSARKESGELFTKLIKKFEGSL